MKEGMVEVYTGLGRGKTTAALGLALRALGQGLKVYMIQFMKSEDLATGEKKMAQKLGPAFQMVQTGGAPEWGKFKPEIKKASLAKEEALKAFDLAKKIIAENRFDVVILDEINVALKYHLIALEDLIKLVKEKPREIELVLTGRHAPKELIEAADLVTEMKEIKHPFQRGVLARQGIDY